MGLFRFAGSRYAVTEGSVARLGGTPSRQFGGRASWSRTLGAGSGSGQFGWCWAICYLGAAIVAANPAAAQCRSGGSAQGRTGGMSMASAGGRIGLMNPLSSSAGMVSPLGSAAGYAGAFGGSYSQANAFQQMQQLQLLQRQQMIYQQQQAALAAANAAAPAEQQAAADAGSAAEPAETAEQETRRMYRERNAQRALDVALAAEQRGQKTRAAAYYRRAVSILPESEIAETAHVALERLSSRQ